MGKPIKDPANKNRKKVMFRPTIDGTLEEQLESLVKIKTYADKIGKSVTWVYKLIEAGEVELVKIDGVNFIKE